MKIDDKMYEMSSKIELSVLEGNNYYDTIIELYNDYIDNYDNSLELSELNLMEQFVKWLSPKIKFELEKELRKRHMMKNNSTIKELL